MSSQGSSDLPVVNATDLIGLKVRRRDHDPAVGRRDADQRGGLDEALDLIDALRALFGDAPVRQESWKGEDFRLS